MNRQKKRQNASKNVNEKHPRMTLPETTTPEALADHMGWSDEALLSLKDACEIFFRGKVTVATLKAEHARGNLDMSKIGRSYWTTIAKLREMQAKCRVAVPARASGSIRKEEPGLSSMVEAEAALGSLLMNLDKLKKPSGNTSRRSTSSKTALRRS